jgi:hypothetical protein
MRFAATSLALYLLALSILPCQDLLPSTCPDNVTEGRDYDAPTEHDDHGDHCTPLCSCACCSVTTDVPPRLAGWPSAEVPTPPRGVTEPRFAPGWSPSAYVAGSWQPPRA